METAIEPGVESVAVERLGVRREEVVAGAATHPFGVRLRDQSQDGERLGRQARLRDDRSREGLAVCRSAPRGIEDRHAVLAQVSRSREQRGDREQLRPADQAPQSLIVREYEESVLPDWPSERASELVPFCSGKRLVLWLCERVAGLEPIAAVELEQTAGQLVRPGPGLHRDDARRRLPELRVVVL